MPTLSVSGHSPGRRKLRRPVDEERPRRVVDAPSRAGKRVLPHHARGNTVYFGDQGGTLYSRNVANGHLFWTYHAGGAIKGGPALVSGVLYFGDYSGRAYAINAASAGTRSGRWGTNGARFGFGSGQFYATPAVAYGRVYMGNTDGVACTRSGRARCALAWATSTGAYVLTWPPWPTPRGWDRPSSSATYDGSMYAFNAQSGAVALDTSSRRTNIRLIHRHRQRRVLLRSGVKDDGRPQRRHRPAGVLVPRWRLHPGDRRLSRPVSRRLQPDLPAAAGPAPRPRAPAPGGIGAPAPGQDEEAEERKTKKKTKKARAKARTKGQDLAKRHRAAREEKVTPWPGANAPNRPPMRRIPGLLCYHYRSLCVVEVEVTVSSRPKRAVGSARSTRQSSIACARSSRTPQLPASVGAGPSDRRPAVVPAVMSRVSRPPRIAIRARLRATWKRPRNRGRLQSGPSKTKLHLTTRRSRHDVSGGGSVRSRPARQSRQGGQGLP